MAPIFAWAKDPRIPPPHLAIETLAALTESSQERSDAASQLIVLAAAELGLPKQTVFCLAHDRTCGSPIAMAIGLRRSPALAAKLIKLAPRPVGFADQILRMALARAALKWLDNNSLADAVQECAPLAMALQSPAGHAQDASMNILFDLAGMPGGRAAFVRLLSWCGEDARTRRWRAAVADRARLYLEAGEALVLDIFETAVIEFGEELQNSAHQARSTLHDAANIDDETLENALALAAWWQPLATLAKIDMSLLRARHGLSAHVYRAGFDLVDVRRDIRSRILI